MLSNSGSLPSLNTADSGHHTVFGVLRSDNWASKRQPRDVGWDKFIGNTFGPDGVRIRMVFGFVAAYVAGKPSVWNRS